MTLTLTLASILQVTAAHIEAEKLINRVISFMTRQRQLTSASISTTENNFVSAKSAGRLTTVFFINN